MSKLTDFRVAVLATHGFKETELIEPMNALEYAGAQVYIVAPEPGKIQGVRNDLDRSMMIKVDRTIQEISEDEFDAVHLPGGNHKRRFVAHAAGSANFLAGNAGGRKANLGDLSCTVGIDIGRADAGSDTDQLSHPSGRYPQRRRHLGGSGSGGG
jgi:hypothetical protein